MAGSMFDNAATEEAKVDFAFERFGRKHWGGVSAGIQEMARTGHVNPKLAGFCHLHMFDQEHWAEIGAMGPFPTVKDLAPLLQKYKPSRQKVSEFAFCEPYKTDFHGYYVHIRANKVELCDDPLQRLFQPDAFQVNHLFRFVCDLKRLEKHFPTARVGVLISDLVIQSEDVTGKAEEFAMGVLARTNRFSEDAAENYHRLGDYMEDIHERGGFAEIGRTSFTNVVKQLVERWASGREATAAARLAAKLIFDPADEPWSPAIFEEAMEIGESEDEKQARLIAMAGMVFRRSAEKKLETRIRRDVFNAWRADALAPAKAFCRAVGVDAGCVDRALERAVVGAAPFVPWAASTLKSSAISAVKVMSIVAAGGVVSAALFGAAGIALDWYYEDLSNTKLGPIRASERTGFAQANTVERARQLFSVGAAISDEAYDTSSHVQVVKIDPFFFSLRADMSRLKDDSAAQRMMTNALVPPLLQNISSTNKTIIMLPGTISEESARHIQDAMPDFYFRIVNRSHSHPELWAVRRGFEMLTAKSVVNVTGCKNVVMIGGNVRQTSKIPGVVANYGPVITGRDEGRHRLKGSEAQRQFFRSVNVSEKFGSNPQLFQDAVAVSFYSAQDIYKQDFLHAMIASGITKAYVALNIPVIMMDSRVTVWDDHVLSCHYEKRGSVLEMSPTAVPVAGYQNDFAATMSWVEPHRPIYGYDATVSTLSKVGSSYLMEVDIGVGPQEAYPTIWAMPDAGYYVLNDLTRNDEAMQYYTVPAQKFDQTVKFVMQLSGAKNVVEATAGRILGLEAQIKIGTTVLERAWHQSHKEFASTVIHAIACAGLNKSDALVMLSRLRTHFSENLSDSLLGRIMRGYKKLLGLQSDARKPGKAFRGANDYDPVTHWTSRQSAGVGFAEAIGNVNLPKKDKAKQKAEALGALLDEGYCSADSLNVDDVGSDSGSDDGEDNSHKKPSIVERLSKFVRPKSDVVCNNQERFAGFKPNSNRQQLIMDQDTVNDLVSDSRFEPAGLPEFGSISCSVACREFNALAASMDDVSVLLADNVEFPAPDIGAAFVVAKALEREIKYTGSSLSFQMPDMTTMSGDDPLDKVQHAFFSEVEVGNIIVPHILLDGIAGSAKSSILRSYIKEYSASAVVVCPTRSLRDGWRKHKVGPVVTKHRLMLGNLRGRKLLVIDEVYAYTKHELYGLLWKANKVGVKTIILGDRRQQYEDGGEITATDLKSLGLPIMRTCVSNTMPVDALYIAKWSSQDDAFAKFYQTRNKIVHSMYFEQKDNVELKDQLLSVVAADNCLVYKERLDPEVQYQSISDSELGFKINEKDRWLSISRTQGLRTQHSVLLGCRFSKMEKWLSEQPGLLYVATSRHSGSMLVLCEQSDLSRFEGLQFGHIATVEGRLSALQAREKFDATMVVQEAFTPRDSKILDRLGRAGMPPQVVKFKSAGTIRDDWRPWHKFSNCVANVAPIVFEASTKRLVGDTIPYVMTDAVNKPTYAAAMGLYSIKRPNLTDFEDVNTKFEGLTRVAVMQRGKDELLDQKNVIERTARPRVLDEDPWRVRFQSNEIFEKFKRFFLKTDVEQPITTFPSPLDWSVSRTPGFLGKMESADYYGITAYSTRSMGFLKTQTKVKLKRTFAMEENYGQTVLASPADFNAMFGPWSKMFLRNLRLCVREGVILDTGYSDKELARSLRRIGALGAFERENYQADVKRQDTSHSPVTLKVFSLLMQELGIPEELCELYEKHSATFQYQSMHAGLYRGEAKYNLGSGDPFTLIRNIVQVLTVMIERFDDQLMFTNMVVKGDDYLADKIMTVRPTTVPELRATQLTEDFNKPPYHAGRFFLEDDIVPDPVKMVAKILVKRTKDVERANQLAESFYDRYIHLTDYSYNKLAKYVVEAYDDFEPEFPLSALEMYHALRDRTLFFDLLCDEGIDQEKKLVVINTEEECAKNAASWFISDPAILTSLLHEPKHIVQMILNKYNVPNYDVTGRPNDFLKRGVWLSEDHAWAVVGLTEYKDFEDDEQRNTKHRQL